MKSKTRLNYPYQGAGRVWQLPRVRLTPKPDGTAEIAPGEVDRIHLAIANYICAQSSDLTIEELEFLADLSSKSSVEIAAYLEMHKSALTKWRRMGKVPRASIGFALKKWFWCELFADGLSGEKVVIDQIRTDADFLGLACRLAIEKGLADRISPMAI